MLLTYYIFKIKYMYIVSEVLCIMRIISGSARGTKLYTLDGMNTRPTLDRVKEPLFNILNFDLENAVVLDLFAGSGALGLEAISRGAKKAIFCEKNRNAIEIIEKNIEKTRFTNKSLLIKNDFEKGLTYINNQNIKVDIVFIDPPYKTDLAKKSVEKILDIDILNDNFIMVIETDEPERILNDIEDMNITVYDKRKYGRVSIIFLSKKI